MSAPNLSLAVAETLLGLSKDIIQTPCFVFFPQVLRKRLDEISESISPRDVHFSLKANPEASVLTLIAEAGFGADVSTQWELDAALEAGFPTHQLSCVGPWKPRQFLQNALKCGIKRISFENKAEAVWLFENASGETELYARILLKQQEATVKENMRAEDSPFGLYPEEIRELLVMNGSRLDGTHLYAGSDFQDVHSSMRSLNDLVSLNSGVGAGLQFGPGLGISYRLDQPDPAWRDLISAARTRIRDMSLSFEVGRYVVAHSVAFLTRICSTKERGASKILILDGGITSFARSILTGARHPVISLDREVRDPSIGRFKLCGPTCTPLDVINADCYFDAAEEGDILAVLCAGAYGANLNLSGFLGYERAPFKSVENLL